MFTRVLTACLVLFVLAGCATGTPGASPASPSDETQAPVAPPTEPAIPEAPTAEPELEPLEWLAQSAFVPSAQVNPNLIPAELPEGFDASEPNHMSSEVPCEGGDTPCGFTIDKHDVSFSRVGSGYVEDSVKVEIFGYSTEDGRSQHLDFLATQGYTFEFNTLDGHRIVRYYDSGTDGRMWASGPYLIGIYSGLDTSEAAPWVDTIASLFLVMFPPE